MVHASLIILIRTTDTKKIGLRGLPQQSGENKFSEYIKVYDNIFTQDECEMILDEYRDCEDWDLQESVLVALRIVIFVIATSYLLLFHASLIRTNYIAR